MKNREQLLLEIRAMMLCRRGNLPEWVSRVTGLEVKTIVAAFRRHRRACRSRASVTAKNPTKFKYSGEHQCPVCRRIIRVDPCVACVARMHLAQRLKK